MGTVYLLHFDEPLAHARHYIGWAAQLQARLNHHRAGSGARLLQVVRERGITWHVSRTWPNATRSFERQLKNQKHAPRLCPECRATVRECRTK